MMSKRFFAFLSVFLLLGGQPLWAGPVLNHVKASGSLACGVLIEPEDFGKSDVHGLLDDLGSDFCHAVAAAVLGDARKVTFASLPDEVRGFEALKSGKIDLLLGAEPSSASSIAFALRFTSPLFFDGMSLLVHRDSPIKSFADLTDKQVCFIGSTPADQVLSSEAARRHIHVLPFPYEEEGEMNVGLLTTHCDAIISSASRLADTRDSFHGRVNDFEVLPDRLSIEPMAPAMRDGDLEWAAVVDAVESALVMAESAGITKGDAATFSTSDDPVLHRYSGIVPGVDEALVSRGWAARAVTTVGNYGEMYERDCGPASALNLPRGLNALWSKGGMIAPASLR